MRRFFFLIFTLAAAASAFAAKPKVTSASAATGQVGVAFSYQITADQTITTYGATGLPGGLTVATTTGFISGTPTTAGTYSVALSVTNGNGTGTATLTLTINPPAPVINSALTKSGAVCSALTYNITATNNPTSYNATGLPAGLAVSTSTGVISGTPTASGTFSVTISATNAGGTGSATLTLTIAPPPLPVVTGGSQTGTVGVSFSYQINATNCPTSYGATGLPPGLTVNNSTGLISGTPTTAGTYPGTISATNSAGTGSATLTITINPAPPVINSALTATGNVGTPFTYTITATNNPTSFGATPLPAGLTVNTSTGVISGTPTTAATTNVIISATNAGGTGTATLVIAIKGAVPVITSPATATGQVGVAFTYTITASNNPTSYGVQGSLPPGVAQGTKSNNQNTISGTPTAAGTYSVTLSATNANGTGTASLVITICPQTPIITSANTATAYVGAPFSYTITASNSPLTFSAAILPPGLAVDSGTGIISGTPTTGGTYNVTIGATNCGGTGSGSLVITVIAPPVITSATAASGIVGLPFTYQITATNNPTSFGAANLPSGLTVNTSTGLISGTPTAAGTFSVTISATNGAGTGSATLTITVTVPTAPVSPSPFASVTIPDLTVGLGTGDTNNGRDGLREASRLVSSDVSPTPTPFDPTTSAAASPAPTTTPTATAAWNSVAAPRRPDGSFYPTSDAVIVLRLTVPGALIPLSTTVPPQNPVLMLPYGFQMMLEYRSPIDTTKWYPYSYLQGNNAVSTWIAASSSPSPSPLPSLNLVATSSTYALNPAPSPTPSPSPSPANILPTVLKVIPTPSPSAPTPSPTSPTSWDMKNLAAAPMLAKADPRSIRYNTQVGVLDVSNPSPAPSSTPWSAGVLGSIWPKGYDSPPIMTPNGNPAAFAQTNGDYGAASGGGVLAGNPYYYDPTGTTSVDSIRPIIMNRPFRSVGEMGYAFRDQPFKTLDFSSATSSDAGLLDLFTVNENTDGSGLRAGTVNLNTRQPSVIAAILAQTVVSEGIDGVVSPALTPVPMPVSSATPAATALLTATAFSGPTASPSASPGPFWNKTQLAKWVADQAVIGATLPKTQRESLVRALGGTTQTRTWNLLIDVVAQSGRYPPGANNLASFVVEGEQHYWVHVAIDRFTGEVIDRQVEVVKE